MKGSYFQQLLSLHTVCCTLSLYHIRGQTKYWLLSLHDGKATQYVAESTVRGNFCSRKFIFSFLRCGCLIRRIIKIHSQLHIHCKTERKNIKRRCCNRHIGVTHNKGEALHQKPWTCTIKSTTNIWAAELRITGPCGE